LVDVKGNDPTSITQEFGQMGCFAPKTGTDIQYVFSWFRCKEAGHDLGRLVLNLEQALSERGNFLYPAPKPFKQDAFR